MTDYTNQQLQQLLDYLRFAQGNEQLGQQQADEQAQQSEQTDRARQAGQARQVAQALGARQAQQAGSGVGGIRTLPGLGGALQALHSTSAVGPTGNIDQFNTTGATSYDANMAALQSLLKGAAYAKGGDVDSDRHAPVVMQRGQPRGGLAKAAEATRQSGVGGDDMIVHVNRHEFEHMRKTIGEPTRNPHTGMPQFTPFWEKSWFAPVASLGLDLLAPGIGSTIGGALGLSGTAASTVGSGLVGAGIGALSNGGQGALAGGLAGAAGPLLLGTGTEGGGGLLGGLNMFGGSNANSSPLSGLSDSQIEQAFNGENPTPSSNSSNGGLFGNLFGGSGNGGGGGGLGSLGPMLAIGALASAMGGGGNKNNNSAAQQQAQQQDQASRQAFNMPLAATTFARQPLPVSNIDWAHYGAGPEKQFYTGNQLGTNAPGQPNAGYATGGLASAANQTPVFAGNPQKSASNSVRGQSSHSGFTGHSAPGDARDDTIPAQLSNGEYVMDGETVSLLGNGDSDAGARKLDKMRVELRKHKGKALAKGRISAAAKEPMEYAK